MRRQGAPALWRKQDGFAVEAVRPAGFDRPWSPAPSGEAERDEGTLLQPKSRAQDAKPAEQDMQVDD